MNREDEKRERKREEKEENKLVVERTRKDEKRDRWQTQGEGDNGGRKLGGCNACLLFVFDLLQKVVALYPVGLALYCLAFGKKGMLAVRVQSSCGSILSMRRVVIKKRTETTTGTD